MRKWVGILLTTAMVSVSLPALAQNPGALSPATQAMLNRLRSGGTLQEYLLQVQREFSLADADSDGRVSRADDEVYANLTAANERINTAMRMMQADLNGDGEVTEEEIRRSLQFIQRGQSEAERTKNLAVHNEKVLAEFRLADADSDGRATFTEILAFVKAQEAAAGERRRSFRLSQAILLFDSNDAGFVTRQDFEAQHEAFFRAADTDGNGILSADELVAHRVRLGMPDANARRDAAQQRQAAERAERERAATAERKRKEDEARAACAMPKPSASAKIVLLSAHRTDAFSTVALGSQNTVTYTSQITVEKGTEPVYLIVSSLTAVIWRFAGAVDRIEHVVLASSHTPSGMPAAPFVGATGVPAERVTMLQGRNCLGYFSDVPSAEAAKVSGQVAQQFGKAPDRMAAMTEVSGFAVSARAVRAIGDPERAKVMVFVKSAGTLTVEGNRKGLIVRTPGRRNLNAEIQRYHPGGVVRIDPKKVVAKANVESYIVLPELAGLQQLQRSGAVKQNRNGEFVIQRKIRTPPGSYNVEFLLPKGVPVPDGEKRSKIVSLETGKTLSGE